MKEQHMLTEGDLLDDNGDVTESGYAYSPLKRYDRTKIKAPKTRIKEWDYFMVTTDDFAVAFTLSDQTYMTLDTIGFMTFGNDASAKTLRHASLLRDSRSYAAPGEAVNHAVKNKKFGITVQTRDDIIHITAQSDNFFGEPLNCYLMLNKEPCDSMVIVTPFSKRGYFYYNQKINCIDAEGMIRIGRKEYPVKRGEAFCCYDCGRGAWTRRNRWYWATCSTVIDGKKVGLNLGYGFGDTSAASENMVFVQGKATKLGDITIKIPVKRGKEDYMGGDWRIEGDGVSLTLKPIVVRSDNINAVFAYTHQNQTFGRLFGTVTAGDDTLEFNGAIAACEVFDNKG